MEFDKKTFGQWRMAGKKIAMARVVKTWRSAPRPAGSVLLVSEIGEMIGSVSGGCVENAVVAKSKALLAKGQKEMVTYGVADEDAWEVGLSCGGALSIYIEPFFNQADWDIIQTYQTQNKALIVLTQLDEGGLHYFIDPELENAHSKEVNEQMNAYLLSRTNGLIEKDGISYFCHVFPAKQQMLLIGSAHITAELIDLASKFNFETVVIDPRDSFAKKTSYSKEPDQLIVKWPQEVLADFKIDHNTYAVVLSHDPKIDDEALKLLLKSEARYIGALGSKKTQAKRQDRLRLQGFGDEDIQRIHGPIGIDIKAMLPREIALSIMAEVIMVKNT